ncbi:hypothetical protein [Aneurinibacillus aneurinilyticus]|uniref:30S ribosomal protein S27ae domain protein n=1 Tax=Aneurinibacillus aneurinilyticus ATCC 12856 TaxID=649747 RepID=U1WFI6_ANEAE|nr:hypothetical protein [Aneurinibacillus aneurinilyticus]ERI07289.1 30S ribosomal protein S27ae domain protein [Aneurinibacillus aneurinilyticus ATCC 12856]MED0709486.1 hypothetical protein [Aneurinibacillus aneurinilyticus]MED0725874.1 hypothetical protein [Aneurinibacillus aneurinilyticus]MED0730406.1 hypothetical protein [Aneurinibacillus aneurinilyticus]MED0739235.1 hypothetical protein [Aneurinibacillus aneurinilyticus]
MRKKEYLVQSPRLSGPCTVRELKVEYEVIKEREAPTCPACGDDTHYILTWEEDRGHCRCCGYRTDASPTLLQ